jgi:hypothetical protein
MHALRCRQVAAAVLSQQAMHVQKDEAWRQTRIDLCSHRR